ncbi:MULTISPECIES: hypothetical protein [Rhodopseudomonas]|uniref:Cell envelope biogenesis protein TolA n=1 Tax=Rhodopseudomonas palustris TaxID=1076 RepID=A0A0D7E3R5_RHOPL|nr:MULTISPECIES: hypothetical protein [Rhodopseudomonas]KIZ35085.1 hypothetical protein OO17_26150 [Rhodopseudomonas palustris]MDF3812213.1 hypothetical protein [Rhodopseudomonas sp. BAL398]WOK18080.1 hypothetical protein RBJ75_00715 [Rhodopseudomonas sp. BAL398]
MMPRLPIRSGAAASVVAHLALLGLVLVLAEVHPFATEKVETIAVDVVTPEEAPPAPAPEVTPPTPLPLDQPTPSPTEAAAPPPEPPPEPAQQPPKPKDEPQASAAPPPQADPKPEAAPPPPALPPAIPQQPDLTVKYSVLLGLPPNTDFDAPAETQADISADSVAALRRHLKSCAALPATLSPGDPVKIVLRVALTPDGRLARPPDLIQGSASAKGPALMHGAIDALTRCQPFTMLPADKYQEWKVLDLGFTPQDFRGG